MSQLAKSATIDSEAASALDPGAIDDVPEIAAPRRTPVRQIVVIALLVAGLIWAVRYAGHMLTHAETDDAYITGYVHQVTPHLGGTVAEVLVEQNQNVKAGDVLFRLDPRDHQAKVDQATAQLAQSDALIAYAHAQIADAAAKIDQSQAQYTKAESDFQRVQELAKTKVVSKQEFDSAKAAFDSAKANLVSTKASAQAMSSALLVAQAQRQNSQSSLDNAKLQLSYNTITAPASGHTSKRSAEVGAYVQPGQALIAVVEPDVWIEANFKETQLAKMRAGQTAEITVDALPGREFTGTVESFSPASGAQFAMLPADNATGNFTKVVQRVPVKIRMDAESIRGFEERLRPGLSTVVSVRLK
ncbi:MAG: HlyD family secretion protein [Chthoniobacter sp.]|uniref:HlyD family secretion protein n=1 Tax=Chthoniobacter sp. TaxID=2510640 RepID=UPI0032ADA44C